MIRALHGSWINLEKRLLNERGERSDARSETASAEISDFSIDIFEHSCNKLNYKMKKLKKGDVVVLNSGGFKMTVKGYVVYDDLAEKTSWVEVVWFDNGKKKERKFHEDSLSIAKFLAP